MNPVLHQPVRTRIVAFLAARGEATFNDVKKAIGITDGNLDAHMKKLVGAGYVETRRETGKGRPQTSYQLSPAGEAEFRSYVGTLEALLDLGKRRSRAGASTPDRNLPTRRSDALPAQRRHLPASTKL